jgi:hypothetical protein
MRYPSVLYETPWEWAVTREVFWLSTKGLQQAIRDLRRNLGWEVSPQECRAWHHRGNGVYVTRDGDEVRLRWDPSRRAWMPRR